MESAFDAFARHEERLQALELRPSEYVRRQVRATPYPTEDVGWIIEQAGPEVCLFSSDYPHVEGGRRPIERFEASLGATETTDAARHAFYQRQLRRPDGCRTTRWTRSTSEPRSTTWPDDSGPAPSSCKVTVMIGWVSTSTADHSVTVESPPRMWNVPMAVRSGASSFAVRIHAS